MTAPDALNVLSSDTDALVQSANQLFGAHRKQNPNGLGERVLVASEKIQRSLSELQRLCNRKSDPLGVTMDRCMNTMFGSLAAIRYLLDQVVAQGVLTADDAKQVSQLREQIYSGLSEVYHKSQNQTADVNLG